MPQPTVAWISDFPLEWLPGIPSPIAELPKQHPTTWQLALLTELEKDPGLRLHIVALRKNIARAVSFERNGVTFHVLKYWGGVRGPSLFWFDTWLVRQKLRLIKPDLVHAWGNERGAGLVASRLSSPFLVTVQGLFNWIIEETPTASWAKLSAWAERKSLGRARHATAESAFVVDYLRKRYPSLTVHHAEHAPNPCFRRVSRKPAQNPIRIVTNGTVSFLKGTDLFLKSLTALLDKVAFQAVVIGIPDEAFLAPLRSSLPSKLWERVTFRTNLRPEEVAEELATATIFVLPTRVDNSPNAVKEAVVAGVPVVASNVGGIPDYVFPGKNGLLFSPGNLEGLNQALGNALAHPLFGRGVVDATTLDQTRAYLSAERMAQNFLVAYRAAIPSPPVRE